MRVEGRFASLPGLAEEAGPAPEVEVASLELEPVHVEPEGEEIPDVVEAPQAEPDRGPSRVRLGIDVPPAGAPARRHGAVAPSAPAAPPAARAVAPTLASRVERPATPPRPNATNRPPRYPLEARRLGWQGTAVFRVVVGSDGRVADVSLERSTGHDALDAAAEEAVRSWTFSPALRDDVPAACAVRLPVVFRLS
jgi:protein TonB